MKLTIAERWILSNQYKILELLSENPDEISVYKENREIIDEGFELLYDHASMNISKDGATLTSLECKEILDILTMFRVLRHGFKKLNDSEKQDVEPWLIKFDGFDGNNEIRELAFLRFFTKFDGGRFEELEPGKDNFNSHIQKLPEYRRMLEKWNELNRPVENISKEDFFAIINARKLKD